MIKGERMSQVSRDIREREKLRAYFLDPTERDETGDDRNEGF
jgi:hypothetical protein